MSKANQIGSLLAKSSEKCSEKYRRRFIALQGEWERLGYKLYDYVEEDGMKFRLTPYTICKKIAEEYEVTPIKVTSLTRSYWLRYKQEYDVRCGR